MNIEALCAAPPEALTHSPSQMPLSCPVAPQAARRLAHADTGRGTHRYDAGLITSRPSAFAHSDTRRAPRRAADCAPPRPRPPPRAEENFTLHLLVCERNTARETLGVLQTWEPATAMLPLPLALSLSLKSPWQQHHYSLSAPRRSAGTAAAVHPCGVASRRCALPL